MQVSAKPFSVMLTVHEQSGLPGRATIREPIAFEAFPTRAPGLRKDSAWVTGGGPNGTNSVRTFWMNPAAADAFKAACTAALMDGHLYTITFA